MGVLLHFRKLTGKKRIAAYVLIQREDKFLLVQERIGAIRALWGLPGGGVKRGEKPESAAEREAEEELSIDIAIKRKIFVFEDIKRESIRHIFLAEITGGEIKRKKLEVMDAGWFSKREVGELKLRGKWVSEAIENVLKNE